MPKPRAVGLLSVCLTVKPVGEPDALIGHVRFDERGWETGRCRMAQATAPILDSTKAGGVGGRQICPVLKVDRPCLAELRDSRLYGISTRRMLVSIRLDVGRSDHLAPLFGFLGDELPKVRWRTRERGAAQVGKPRLEDLTGRIPGRSDAKKCTRLIAGHAQRRCPTSQRWASSRRGGYRQSAQLPSSNVLD